LQQHLPNGDGRLVSVGPCRLPHRDDYPKDDGG
jgi:hypothetical protein